MWNLFRFWNFAPNARNDSYSTDENNILHVGAAASVLKNDTDLNGDTLTVVGVNGAATVGSPVTLASGATVTLNADGTFDYDPNGKFDYLGDGQTATDSFSYRVADGRGGFDTATVSVKINGVGPVDKKPVALPDLDKATAGEADTHGNVITGQDPDGAANKLLLLADNQGDGPAIIRSITHDGVTYTLSADETAVTVSGTPAGAWSYDDTTGDLTITTDLGGTLKIDLDGASPGDYAYTPPASIGSGWWQSLPPFLRDIFNFKTETFAYKIEDTDGDTSSSLLTVTVKEGQAVAVNQAPSGADATVATLEDTPHTFTTGEFGFSDPDGNALQAVIITSLPAAGALTLDGADVAAGQSVSAADIDAGKLLFTPAENASGTGYASLAFQVQDDGGTASGGVDLDQTPNTITIDVTPVNDAPESGSLISIAFEDTPHVFGLTDFPLLDDADSPPNDLLAVKITTLPDSGSLTLDGAAVAAGDFISADDIAAGKLVFTPDANSNASTSFTFQVQDDGGTANGGIDLDPTPNQASFQFIPVNDAPVAVDDTAATDEDTPVNIDVLANDTDVDSPTLYVAEASAAHGTVAIETDGTITYTPDANFNGTDTINYTVADGDPMFAGFLTDTATVTVTVNPVNDPPEAPSVSLGTIATGGSRIITTDEILGHVTDIDSATVTLQSLTIQSGAGTLQDLGDGSWLYTGVAGDTSSVVFAYTVSDGSAQSTGQALLNLNSPITASEIDLGSGPEDTAQTFTFGDFLAGAHDDDGPSLAVTSVSVDSAFGVVQHTGPTWTFTPAQDYSGPVTFTYTVSDGFSTATSTATFTVTPVNDAPDSESLGHIIAEDTPRVFVLTDFAVVDDADWPPNDLLAVKITTLPDSGSLTLDGAPVAAGDFISAEDIAAGKFVFTPEENSTASTSFTFQVQDDGGTADGGVDLDPTPNQQFFQFIPVNDAPVAVDDTAETNEDTPVNIDVLANDTDVDSPTLYVTEASAAHGTVVIEADGTITYTPDANFNGVDSILYTVADGDVLAADTKTDTATVTVTVNSVNDAPEIADQGFSVAEESLAGTAVGTVLATDVDDTDLTYTIAGGNDLGLFAIDANTGALTLAQTVDDPQVGSYALTVTADDGTNPPQAATVTIEVTPVNDAPVATPIDAGTTDEDATPTTIDLLATASDADMDALSIRAIGLTDDLGATVAFTDNTDGTITIDPSQYNTLKVGESRTLTVSYEVFDGTEATTNTATLVVEGRNDAPIANDQSFAVAEESTAGTPVGTILATDIEGEAIRFIVDPAATGPFSVDVDTGVITLAQDVDDADVGDHIFTVDVLDRSGGITPITVTATVTPVDDAPVISDQSFSVAEESLTGTAVGTVLATDVDSPSLTYAIAAGNDLGLFAIDANTGALTLAQTVDDPQVGSYALTVTVDDGTNPPQAATVTIEVTPVNDPPVIADQAFSVAEESLTGAAVGTVVATDVDDTSLAYAIAAGNDLGLFAIDASTGAITLAQDVDDPQVGSYALTVTVDDGTNPAQAATVTIEVTPVNDPPVVDQGIADQSVGEDTLWSFVVRADAFADVDSPSLTLTATLADGSALPAWLNFDGTTFTGTPPQDFNGDIGLKVTASDGEFSAEQAFTLTVDPVPDNPVAADDTGTGFVTDEETAFTTASVLANDSDPDGDLVTFTGFDATGAIGVFTYNGDGTFDYDPNGQFDALGAGETATDTITYTVSDGTGREDTATLTVTIDGINDAPRTIDDSFGANSDYDAFVVGTGEVYLGVNDGNGTFVTSPLVQDSLTRDGAAFGDLNGDGNLDVFVAGDGPERVWINDGQGNLTQVTNVTTANDSNNYDVELGDINGDGTLDAVVASNGSTANRIWLNDGSGTNFTAGASLNYAGKTTTYDVAVADIDKDGDLDIIEANAGVNRIWLNQGGGVFSTANVIDFGSAAENSRDVAVADLNNDGYLDIFIANEDSGNTVWLNNGDSENPGFTQVPGSLGNGESRAVALGDLNGDGTIDAFVANSGTAGGDPDNNGAPNEVWLNDGHGNFTLSENNGVPLGNYASLDVELADVDGDGDLDALVANNVDGQPNLIWYNDGNGNFTSDGTAIGDFAARDVALGDIDGDAALAADQVQVLDVLANDADPDANDTLTIISIDPGDLDGALTIAPDGKSIEFDPSGSATLQALVRDSLGTYDFTYTVSDGHGGTDTASVEITVRGVNEPPSLAVTTLADDSYDGGTLAEELADGGGLSLREAIGVINDGTVSETRITFDDSIAGGQIDLSGDLAITASMDIDGGTAGMTVAGNGSDRVFTIDGGATTSISVSLDTLTITGGGSVNRGGGVRVLAGDHVSITNSLLVGNDANNFGDAIAVESGASATLTNTTVADNGVGTSYAVQSEGTITMSNVTVTGNAHGVGISGGTATTVNSIVLGNGGTADFTVSGFGTTYAFNGLSIIGEGTDTDPSDGKIDGDPVQVFAGSDPSGAGILADNGGPTLTVALRNDPSNPALDAAIGGTETDQRGVAAFDAVAGTGDSGNNRDIGAYELSANAPHAPVAADDAFTGPEDTEITGNVLADNGAGADSDADNDVLSVIAGTFATAQGGSVTLNADGSFSYLPVANFNGTDSFDYRVTDGTLSDTGTVTLTVTPVPDAPVAIDDAFTGRQDTQISGNVLADNGAGADYDPDGEAPTAVEMSVANLGGGGITINEDGSFIYAPAAGFTGTESFTYQIRDLGGLTDTGRITFTVVPNAAPVATADGYSLDEDTTLAIAAPGVLANDSDANGDALSAILVNDVTHGTLTLNGDGSFSYMPDANYNGADSFTYKTNDGLVDSNTVTVDLTVNPVADPAQIVGDFSGAVTEDGTLVANGSVSISDVDGDLSSTDFVPGIFVDPDGYGQFRVFTNGDWQFTLNNSSPLVQQLGVDPLFGTADTITRSYTVESLDGGLSETVDITISGANDVATITGDSAGTVYAAGYAEGPINDAPIISGKLDISDADAGQDILSTGLLAQSTLGTFDYDADGNWTFDLNENYPGLIDLGAGDTLTATYTLTSLDGTASQDVTITIERLVLIHLDPNLATVADPGTTDPITNPTQPPATPIEGGLIGATVVTTDTSSASTTTTSPAPGELFTYHLGDGPITIADFDQASAGQTGDHIVLSGFDLDFNALDTSGDGQIDTADASVTGYANGLTLDFGNGDSLTVEHVSALHHDDLLFS